MRSYPIDTDRVTLISTGVVSPVAKWIETSDGARRPDPNGRQDTDDAGRALWRVEVITPADPADERDKTAVVEILIASNDRPEVGQLGTPLAFTGLVVSPGYVKKGTSTITPARWSAEGIRRPAAARQAA